MTKKSRAKRFKEGVQKMVRSAAEQKRIDKDAEKAAHYEAYLAQQAAARAASLPPEPEPEPKLEQLPGSDRSPLFEPPPPPEPRKTGVVCVTTYDVGRAPEVKDN